MHTVVRVFVGERLRERTHHHPGEVKRLAGLALATAERVGVISEEN